MSQASPYERQLISDALALREPPLPAEMALVLAPDLPDLRNVCDAAVWPALNASGFRRLRGPAFDSFSWLGDLSRWIDGAQIIIADLTGPNPDVLYALGLAHGLGRCPLLIGQNPEPLPFQLRELRCIPYRDSPGGLWDLREELARAIRVFLTSGEASRHAPD